MLYLDLDFFMNVEKKKNHFYIKGCAHITAIKIIVIDFARADSYFT